MNRITRWGAVAFLVPAIGASAVTTAFAEQATPSIVTPGSHWRGESKAFGCLGLTFETGNKWVGDKDGEAGTWTEPTSTTLAMKFTAGLYSPAAFKGKFSTSKGDYSGHLSAPGQGKASAKILPGSKAGC
jgi:hypothetical protein